MPWKLEEYPFNVFARLFDRTHSACMALDRDLRFVYANEAYLQTTKTTREHLLGQIVFDAFPDTTERMARVEEIFQTAFQGTPSVMDEEPYELIGKDGEVSTRYWRAQQLPFLGEDGSVTHVVQFAADVTDEIELRERNQVISDELDHRVKNMFAVIAAIIAMTRKSSDTIESYQKSLQARIVAMGRTHTALSASKWTGLALSEIIEAELEPFVSPTDLSVTLDGPDIVLTAKSAQDASMIVHELSTNAAKYGCFSQQGGRLDIAWRVDVGTRELCVDWIESGLSGVAEPTETGFGFQLGDWMPNLRIERRFRPEGLETRFRIAQDIAVR